MWPAGARALEVTNSFDADNDGWRTGGMSSCTDPTLSPASWSAATGNPGGAISGVDTVDPPENCGWAFVGPASLAGVRTANYGGTVSFDIRLSTAATQPVLFNFVDTEGHFLVISKTGPQLLADQWTPVSFKISADPAGWQYSTDGMTFAPATEADFIDVLSDLNAVAVAGELDSPGIGATTSLDNFKLTNGPPRDTDLDGVTDTADNCPLVPGPVTNSGCPAPPDGDGDTVPDASDQCPAVSGPPSNNGCPMPSDADGDTVPDASDQCPADFGPPSNNGCPPALVNPDPDGDGLIGTTDRCPSEAGPAANDGCPAASRDAACDAAKKKLKKAKAKLKKLRRHDAKPPKVAKAKQKVKTAKAAVKKACA
jgi:hypothetical protein